jgi:hypothetical protein
MKKEIFTEECQKMLLSIIDFVFKCFDIAGCVRMFEIIRSCKGGDAWKIMACVDRLVELGEIQEVQQKYSACQSRIFINDKIM